MSPTALILSYVTDWRYLIPAVIGYQVLKVIYRLWFHPLRKIPGPRFAAAACWYLTYWHALKKGHFVPYVLPELHKKYGPVVRFSSTEVNIHDKDVYYIVYGPRSLYRKDCGFFDAFRCFRSPGILKDMGEWRTRRTILNPMFSKKAINGATDRLIYPLVEKFCNLLDDFAEKKKPVNFDSAAYSVTVDITTSYTSGKPWNMLDEPEFSSEKIESIRWLTRGSNFPIWFPSFRRLTMFLNQWFPSLVLEGYTMMYKASVDFVNDALQEDAKAKVSGNWKQGQKPMYVYDAMVNSDTSKGLTRPPFDDMVDETMLAIAAGGDKSANMLRFSFWTLIQKPEIRKTMLKEVDGIWRLLGQPTFADSTDSCVASRRR